MIWKAKPKKRYPEVGSSRVVDMYTWFPTKINEKWYWFEKIRVKQCREYISVLYEDLYWKDTQVVSNETPLCEYISFIDRVNTDYDKMCKELDNL